MSFKFLKGMDFYRKIPADLTVSTFTGGSLSIFGAVFMFVLFVLELNSYLTVETSSHIMMDERQDELLQIHFNISMPNMACEYTSVDVADFMGTHNINVTSNIRKWKLDGQQRRLEEVAANPAAPKYVHDHVANEQISLHLDTTTFSDYMKSHKMVILNFYAPWCIWSQRLGPVWEHVAGLLKEKDYGEMVGMARIDCTNKLAHPLCHQCKVSAFPTIQIFKAGGEVAFARYNGDRTPEALLKYLDDNWITVSRELGVKPNKEGELTVNKVMEVKAKKAEEKRGLMEGMTEGCRIAGQVDVKKVPGNFHISAHAGGYSFDQALLNVSHVVHSISFGSPLPDKVKARLPNGETLRSPLDNRAFVSNQLNMTQEHYIKVVSTVFEVGTSARRLETYQYTVSSASYSDIEHMPSAKFSYDMSPMMVVHREERVPIYHFLTSICAIIGGVFTVLGLLNSTVDATVQLIKKKTSLGKQG